MIKSTLFRQPPKQVKLPQAPSNKTISLAEVAQQLQCTAIADNISLSVPVLSTDHIDQDSQLEIKGKTKSTDNKGLNTCECCEKIGKNSTGAQNFCSQNVKGICASRSGPKQTALDSQLLFKKCDISDNDGNENYETGRSLVHERWAMYSSGVNECKAHRRLRLDSKRQSAVTVAAPSAFGLTLCFNAKRSRGLLVRRDGRKWPAVGKGVTFKRHISELAVVNHWAVTKETMLGNFSFDHISAFDFSTPSPDDIVRDRQKSAFRS